MFVYAGCPSYPGLGPPLTEMWLGRDLHFVS